MYTVSSPRSPARGRAAHEGRFSAAGSPLENDQIIKPCVEELVIQPIKPSALFAPRKNASVSYPPPMVLSFYLNSCAAASMFARAENVLRKRKSARHGRFFFDFSDAEQLALLRRELLLGEHAGVQQRFVLLSFSTVLDAPPACAGPRSAPRRRRRSPARRGR